MVKFLLIFFSFLWVSTAFAQTQWLPKSPSELMMFTRADEKIKEIEPFSKFIAIEKIAISSHTLAYQKARWSFVRHLYIDNPKISRPQPALRKFIKFCKNNNLFIGNHKAFEKAATILGFELITDKLSFDVDMAPLRVFRDIAYVTHHNYSQRLDLFLPEKVAKDPIPAVVFIHGGGWRVHKRAWFESYAAVAAQHGMAAITIDYRMLHAVSSPLYALHDAKAAVRWLRENAGKYGIDPTKIAAVGASAGAQLATMLATTGDIPMLESEQNDSVYSSKIQAAVGFSTPTLTGHRKTWPWRKGDKPLWFDLLSPYQHTSADDAPILFVHGKDDGLVSYKEAYEMYEKQKKYKIDSQFELLDGKGHVFYNSRPFAVKAVKFIKQQFGLTPSENIDDKV